MYPQFTEFRAKVGFAFRPSDKGRPITVREGDTFVNTNTALDQTRRGAIQLDRRARARIGTGYHFTPEQVATLFEQVA